MSGTYGTMETISYEEFKKVDLRVGKILAAARVEGSDKLLKLEVDIGSSPSTSSGRETRQIIGGIGKVYSPEELIGREIVIVANLLPRKLMSLESQGMLLAADQDGNPTLLTTMGEVAPGSEVR